MTVLRSKVVEVWVTNDQPKTGKATVYTEKWFGIWFLN